jgi:predicted nucleic acid-binding protein
MQSAANDPSVCADAAYLELAQRRRFGLATLDRRLNAAVRHAGLKTMAA